MPENPVINDNSRRLRCLIEGEYVVFTVEVSCGLEIGDLKEAIQSKRQQDRLRDVGPHTLELWKVAIDLNTNDKHSLSQLKARENSEELESWKPISEYWSDKPSISHLHIIVTIGADYRRPWSPPAELDIIRESMDKFLQKLRPKIKEFLSKPRLPVWEPPETVDQTTRKFYRGLSIPSIKDNRPNLLLHKLGVESNPHVDNLFHRQKHTILWNTSGAGKTRLLFEGLCNHWGFYFVSARDTDGIGAQDMKLMIARMSTTEGWVGNIFEHGDTNAVMHANAVNTEIAFNRIYRVLVARWMVFQTFIQVAKEENSGNLPDTIKRDWLLFQILPLVVVDDRHPFVAFMNACLSKVSTHTLQTLLDGIGPSVVLGSAFNQKSFPYVLDEAQVAGELYMGAFTDADAKNRWPLLRPIVLAWASLESESLQIIVSGTGFSLDLFEPILRLGVGKNANKWDVVRRMDDFTNQDTQASYIRRYIPPSFLFTESGAALVTRMFEWLRGRHRLTARYLEELISGAWTEERPCSPHKLLDAYVHTYTEFTPIDGDRITLAAEPEVKPPDIQGFAWDKVAKVNELLMELSMSIDTFILRGTYPTWYGERHDVVECGLGRFIGDGPDVIIDEPMALMSILRYFEKEGRAPDDICSRHRAAQ